MIATQKGVWFIMLLLICAGYTSALAAGIEDHRIRVKIDGQVNIVPGSKRVGRAMLGMVRHPDGTIYLNTQRQGLYKSNDNGKTWAHVHVKPPEAPGDQKLHGLGVSSSGILYLLHHSNEAELFISTSTDGGTAWSSTQIDWANLKNPSDPYSNVGQDYNSFVELADGTMMTAIELRYPQAADYLGSPKRCGMHETVIRSTDGGQTWGDPTPMHQFVAETSMAVDPNDPSHILAMTRIQRGLLRGENAARVMRKTRCPAIWHARGNTATSVYKNGILLESTDKGRSFSEVRGGIIGFYAVRGTILWATNDVIAIAHQGGLPQGGTDGRVLARISLDGGKTWVNGSKTGTPMLNRSKKFELVPYPPGHSFMTPTVEISPNHFMTAYAYPTPVRKELAINGVFWHIEGGPEPRRRAPKRPAVKRAPPNIKRDPELVFYEGFDYKAGPIDTKGPWTNATNTVAVSRAGLSYPGLAVSPGAAKYMAQGAVTSGGAHVVNCAVGSLFNSSKSVFYFSMLLGGRNKSPHGNVFLRRDTNNDGTGILDEGIYFYTASDGDVYVRSNGIDDVPEGEDNQNLGAAAGTKLIVARVTMRNGHDEIAWILNPNLATLADLDFNSAPLTASELSTDDLDYLSIHFGPNGADTLVDEIRFGTTLKAVIPTP